MIRRKHVEALVDTLEILSNTAIMQLIQRNEADIMHASGISRSREWIRPSWKSKVTRNRVQVP